MKFFYNDLMQAAGVGVSGSSEDEPAAKLLTEEPTDRWQASGVAANTWLKTDLTATGTIDSLAIIGANMRLEANASGTWYYVASSGGWAGTPTKITSVTFDATKNVLINYLDASVDARYLGLRLNGTTALGHFRIGRLMAGTSWEPSAPLATEVSIAMVDPSTERKTEGGQSHIDQWPTYDIATITMAYLQRQEFDSLRSATQALQKFPAVVTVFEAYINLATDDDYTYYGSVSSPTGKRRADAYDPISLTVREWK